MNLHKRKRFQVILTEQEGLDTVRIYLDTLTGVQYLCIGTDEGGGLTPLLGPDGKPVITHIRPE